MGGHAHTGLFLVHSNCSNGCTSRYSSVLADNYEVSSTGCIGTADNVSILLSTYADKMCGMKTRKAKLLLRTSRLTSKKHVKDKRGTDRRSARRAYRAAPWCPRHAPSWQTAVLRPGYPVSQGQTPSSARTHMHTGRGQGPDCRRAGTGANTRASFFGTRKKAGSCLAHAGRDRARAQDSARARSGCAPAVPLVTQRSARVLTPDACARNKNNTTSNRSPPASAPLPEHGVPRAALAPDIRAGAYTAAGVRVRGRGRAYAGVRLCVSCEGSVAVHCRHCVSACTAQACGCHTTRFHSGLQKRSLESSHPTRFHRTSAQVHVVLCARHWMRQGLVGWNR